MSGDILKGLSVRGRVSAIGATQERATGEGAEGNPGETPGEPVISIQFPVLSAQYSVFRAPCSALRGRRVGFGEKFQPCRRLSEVGQGGDGGYRGLSGVGWETGLRNFLLTSLDLS